jgi:hypothetical protein
MRRRKRMSTFANRVAIDAADQSTPVAPSSRAVANTDQILKQEQFVARRVLAALIDSDCIARVQPLSQRLRKALPLDSAKLMLDWSVEFHREHGKAPSWGDIEAMFETRRAQLDDDTADQFIEMVKDLPQQYAQPIDPEHLGQLVEAWLVERELRARQDDINTHMERGEIAEAVRLAATPLQSVSLSSPLPAPLDLARLSTTEPRNPRFIVQDWLPPGVATLFGGHGGSGKSYVALALLVCIAAGRPWCGLRVRRRRVLYLSCEDRSDVLHWRLEQICAHLGVDMAALDGWLAIVDMVDTDALLMRSERSGSLAPTSVYEAVRHMMRDRDVLVADSLTDVYGGDENDRSQIKAFINALLRLIDARRGAVLLIGHVNKPTAASNNTTEGYSGSTQWHNAVRSRWYLTREGATPRRLLHRQKNNYGADGEMQIEFVWDEERKVFTAENQDAGSRDERKRQEQRDEEDAVLAALRQCRENGVHVPAAKTGQKTGYHVLEETGRLPDYMNSGEGARRGRTTFWAAVGRLTRAGVIRLGSATVQRRKIAVLELAE